MGEKITIDGVEYDVDKLKESIGKAEDYTQKTQKLAEERRALEERSRTVEAYENLFNYAESEPNFKKKLEKLIQVEQKKVQGLLSEDDSDDDEFDVGSDYLEEPTKGKKKPKVATQDDIQKAVQEAVGKVLTIQQQEKLQENLVREFDELHKTGYTQDELNKVIAYAKSRGVSSPRLAVDAMIGAELLPNRFKKKQEEDPVPLLKGRSASGFDIPDPEKELVKFNGDPAEMLKANLDKLFIEED